MSAPILDDDFVLQRVTKALIKAPQSMGELAAAFDFEIQSWQLDEALDVLEEAGALNERQEPRHGSLVSIYEIRIEHRTSAAVKAYKQLQRDQERD